MVCRRPVAQRHRPVRATQRKRGFPTLGERRGGGCPLRHLTDAAHSTVVLGPAPWPDGRRTASAPRIGSVPPRDASGLTRGGRRGEARLRRPGWATLRRSHEHHDRSPIPASRKPVVPPVLTSSPRVTGVAHVRMDMRRDPRTVRACARVCRCRACTSGAYLPRLTGGSLRSCHEVGRRPAGRAGSRRPTATVPASGRRPRPKRTLRSAPDGLRGSPRRGSGPSRRRVASVRCTGSASGVHGIPTSRA